MHREFSVIWATVAVQVTGKPHFGSDVQLIKGIWLQVGATVSVFTWAKVLILIRKKHGAGSSLLQKTVTEKVNFAMGC